MYDGGNFLSFNQGTAIAYSDGVIADLAPAGVAGRYFTRKVQGMFLFAAEIDGASTFEISGNLGADGSGFVDGVVLQTTVNNTPYLGFVKRVSNAFGDPSVNHLVIVRDGPGLGQQFALNTDNDFHQITGLQGTIRLYDLLFAGENGFYIDDYAMLQIMNQFLGLYGGWLAVDPSGGAVPPRSHQDVIVTFDARGLDPGVYQQSLLVFNNDPLNPLVTVPVTFNVDIVTAVALSLVSADAGPGVAKLTWLAAGSAGTAGTVYRREGSEPWVSVGDVAADGLGYLRFEDRAVAAGHTYGYRFGLSGAEQFTPEVLVRIPEALVFAFHGARPNPARGELHVAFTLPDEAPATLDLLDLAGRRVATMPVGALGPGDHVVSLGGTQALAEGIYLLRFTRLGHSFVTKAAVMH